MFSVSLERFIAVLVVSLMIHSHQLFSQPKTIAIANRINWVVLYPMDAFIPAFCDFVYKHMWMNHNRNRNSLEKSRCDSSIISPELTLLSCN